MDLVMDWGFWHYASCFNVLHTCFRSMTFVCKQYEPMKKEIYTTTTTKL